MACGCGGACCQDNSMQRGLGFLWWGGESGGGSDLYGDYDYLYDYGGGSDLYGDYDYFFDYGGGYGGYVPGGPSFNVDFGFLPTGTATGTGTYGTPDDNWQGLLDWWNDLVNSVTNNPPLLGYCPDGTYHPLNDPYACVPFPPETPEFEKQQRAAVAHKAAQDALKAQQRAQRQQQQCPPNTGLVKNAQGQCVCPPGYAPNAQLKKCVLVNPALAAQSKQSPDWLKWALLAGVVVLVVKRK